MSKVGFMVITKFLPEETDVWDWSDDYIDDVDDFAKIVEEAMKDGWRPHGTMVYDERRLILMQPMIRGSVSE